jgi:uncharacterized membrane protein YsdA (DUF1294 family)
MRDMAQQVIHRPRRRHFLFAMLLTAACTVALWWFLSGRWTWAVWIGCWLVSINVIAFAYYGYDKSRAESNSPRVPELVLHGLTAAGGSVGAYGAMKLFGHKTIKGKFRILFWCIVLVQLALAGWIVKLMWWG